MTEYPDLNKQPSAGQPPPYPPNYGQPQYGQPQYGQPQYGQPQYGAPGYPPAGYGPPVPTYPYASWGSRVAAALLDALVGIPGLVVMIIGFFVMFAGAETSTDRHGTTTVESVDGGNVAAGLSIILLGGLLAFAIAIWNIIWRQGKTGQSLGKKWMHISTIVEQSGQPMGLGISLVRYILNSVLTGACFLNVLWPLFDDKKRCWHDMILGTVVVRVA